MKTNRHSRLPSPFRFLRGACGVLLAACWLVVVTSCTVTTADSGTATGSTGTLSVTWTIASSAGTSQCTTFGAASIVLSLTDSTGGAYGSPTTVACASFAATISALPAGVYALTAQAVDATGTSVGTKTLPVSVTITADQTTTEAIDFPVSSFTTAPATTGTLVVTWTIAAGTDATACTTYGAANISIQLTDQSGNAYGAPQVVGCSAFTTSISSLPAGTYSLTATMTDANGTAVTSAVGPTQLTIAATTTTTQPVDFPATSFTTTSPTTGTLVVSWTIASGTDATACTTYGAVNLSVQLEDASGNVYGAPHTVSCSAFTTTISNLPPANYGVTAEMVDATGAPVSGQVGPVQITVTANTTTTQPVDFPANSFTAPAGTNGTVAVSWNIAGATDASLCTAHSASTVSLQLYDSSSQPYGSPYTAACSAFATTIANVPPGTYGVGAQMLGATSQAASTAVPPVNITVTAGATTSQAFSFPANAFYM